MLYHRGFDIILSLLQVEYQHNVHLIRGNHEAADINALFGFRIECIERMVMYNASASCFHSMFSCLTLWLLFRVNVMESGCGTE